MKSRILTLTLFATVLLTMTLGSCNKEQDTLKLQLPSIADVDSINKGDYSTKDELLYSDDGGVIIELNPINKLTAGAKLSILRTRNQKTLYTFTLLQQDETHFVIEFSSHGIFDGATVDASKILEDYNGTYELIRIKQGFKLIQLTKKEPAGFCFHE